MKNDRPGTAEALRASNHVVLAWRGDQLFEAGRPGGPSIRIDAQAAHGPGPVDTLLAALAACVSVDVVEILKKRRTPATALEVDAIGERSDDTPRRVTKAHLTFRVAGAGIDREQLGRAIDLAVNKYCSVRDSLDPGMPVTWSIELREG